MDTPASDLPLLNAVEARVLGSLIEKKELTPDIYPLSLNATQSATNQKTAREPVMTLEPADIHRSFKSLQDKGLVRQVSGSRVERYEHLLSQRFSLTRGQTSLIGLMMLRGPQTAHELMARAERMARYASVEELLSDLDLLIGRKTPLVQLVERGPGQREDRYAHLLCGPVASAPRSVPMARAFASADTSDLEARVAALEAEVADLRAMVEQLRGG
ncbi:MAG: YceH family protein [Mesorhizobium sp.]